MNGQMKVLQVVGYKNAGKTGLVCDIVRLLSSEGLKVGTLKRDDHDAEPEPAGADTRQHREAGAQWTVLASASKTMWVRVRPARLEDLLAAMDAEGADAVVIEGFKTASYPKLVLLRGEEDLDLLRLPGAAAVGVRGSRAWAVAEQPANSAGLPLFQTDGLGREQLLSFARGLLYAP